MTSVLTPVPVQDGDRWGGFVFADVPSTVKVTVTPAPIDFGEFAPFDYPGFRKFATVDELVRSVASRVAVRAPAFLPTGVELIGAWSIEAADGRISDTTLTYRFAGSDAHLGDPDILVGLSYRVPSPFVYEAKESTRPNGQIHRTPRRVSVRGGKEAVFLPFENPPGLHRSLNFASALSWFESEGAFWTVQGKNLDFATLSRIAESLVDLPPYK